MKLSEKQQTFLPMIAKLIEFATAKGYGLTVGDAYRDPRLHGQIGVKAGYGHAKSCHKLRLAIDLNLFKDGAFLQGKEAEFGHAELHDYWDTLGGAPRIVGDANHYSLEWEGMR